MNKSLTENERNGKTMLCENCLKRDATTHIKQVENGIAKNLHLCSECARSLGYSDILGGLGINLSELFTSIFGDNSTLLSDRVERCENCGSSFNDIIKSGAVGCSACYRKFYNNLVPSIERIHGKVRHNGKVPVNIHEKKQITKEEILERLNREMDEAVKNQNFEEAAVLRDKIRVLKEGE